MFAEYAEQAYLLGMLTKLIQEKSWKPLPMKVACGFRPFLSLPYRNTLSI
jgi:hypothetical protein